MIWKTILIEVYDVHFPTRHPPLNSLGNLIKISLNTKNIFRQLKFSLKTFPFSEGCFVNYVTKIEVCSGHLSLPGESNFPTWTLPLWRIFSLRSSNKLSIYVFIIHRQENISRKVFWLCISSSRYENIRKHSRSLNEFSLIGLNFAFRLPVKFLDFRLPFGRSLINFCCLIDLFRMKAFAIKIEISENCY